LQGFTGPIEIEKKNADEELEKLEKELENLSSGSDRINHEIQQLKIGITKKERDIAADKAAVLEAELTKVTELINAKKKELNERIAAGEYIDLLDAREKLKNLEEERRSAEAADDGKIDIGCIAYNIRLRMEERLAEITDKEHKIANSIMSLSEEKASTEKLREAAVQNLAVVESRLRDRNEKYDECIKKVEELGNSLSERKLLPPHELLDDAAKKKVKILSEIESSRAELSRITSESEQLIAERQQLEQREAVLKENAATFKMNIDKQREEAGRLKRSCRYIWHG
jgi:hypothetical protein